MTRPPRCGRARSRRHVAGRTRFAASSRNLRLNNRRHLLIRANELTPSRFGVGGLGSTEVAGQVLGVDLPAGAEERNLVQGHALGLDDQDGLAFIRMDARFGSKPRY